MALLSCLFVLLVISAVFYTIGAALGVVAGIVLFVLVVPAAIFFFFADIILFEINLRKQRRLSR